MGATAIICTYNEEKCIQHCLKTLLSTDTRIDEVIIIDDNSTDDTEEKVRALRDPRIHFFKKPGKFHRGKNDSLHLGALHASNEDLLMLDADLEVRSTTDMIDKLEHGCDVVGGIIDVVDDETLLAKCEKLEYDIAIRRARPWLLKKLNYINNVSGAFFGIKRSRMLSYRIPQYVIGEDMYTTQHALKMGWKVCLSTSEVATMPTPGLHALFIQRCRWVWGYYSVMRGTKRYTPLVESTTIYYRTLVTAWCIVVGMQLTDHFWILTFAALVIYFLNEYRASRSIMMSIIMMMYRQINFASALLCWKYGRVWKVNR